jgi:hypothetical protein
VCNPEAFGQDTQRWIDGAGIRKGRLKAFTNRQRVVQPELSILPLKLGTSFAVWPSAPVHPAAKPTPATPFSSPLDAYGGE